MPKSIDKQKYCLFLFLTLAFPIFFYSLRVRSSGLRLWAKSQAFYSRGSRFFGSRLLRLNPEVASRYFSQSSSTPRPPEEYFLREKPENSYRIFMIGGSTTAGWPYPNHVMASRVLNLRLADAFPDLHVEVINTGIAAVNSHTLRDFMDEILAQKPDAILVYAGHNEFYGALGAASTESLGGMHWFIRSYLRLLRFKTVQWLRDRFHGIRRWSQTLEKGKSEGPHFSTLMGEMIGTASIPYNGTLYRRAHTHFQANLREILEQSRAAGVRILVSELVSNIRDHRPFVPIETADDEAADRVFKRARELESEGEYDLAREAYYRAKDLDGLRFRAAEALNEIIRETAKAFDVPVVPMKQYFEAASPNGLIGANIMLEHLHPTTDGYLLIAEAFFEGMREHGFIRDVWDSDRLKPASFYAEQWPVTAYDRALGKLRILHLMDHWPFTPPLKSSHGFEQFQPATPAEDLAYRTMKDEIGFIEGHIEMAKVYMAEGQVDLANREFQALIRSSPFDATRYILAARFQFENKELEAALDLLRSALLLKNSPVANKWSGHILLELSQSKEALPYLEKAFVELPNDTQLLYNLSEAYALEGRKEEARNTLMQLEREDGGYVGIDSLRKRINAN